MEERTRPYRVLVVDDEPNIVRLIVRHLEAAGYETGSESDGTFALKRLHQETFDLVITDLLMSEMDGVELIRRIRRDENLSAIPIILLSASPAGESLEEKALAMPDVRVDLRMSKPFHPQALIEFVGKILSQRAA